MIKVDIKPLSVNEAWKGRRFKTDKYRKYQRDLLTILPKIEVPTGKIELFLEFGFSNKASDFDNPVKCFVDCLQKKYGFNDKLIRKCIVEAKDVKKGQEYVRFNLKELEE